MRLSLRAALIFGVCSTFIGVPPAQARFLQVDPMATTIR